MEVRLLGPVEVLGDDGAPIALASVTQRLLVAGLAARAGEVVTTDALVELLWGDALPEDPLGALQSQVSRLRRRLGPAAPIETTAGGYRFSDQDIVDAVRFRRSVAQARLAADGDLTTLDAALALWRGRPLANIDSPLLEPFVAALEDDHADAAERRIAALLTLSRYREAATAASELAAALPFREGPITLHMESLAKAGRRADALRVYETFRRSLVDELGLEPSADLRELHGEILDGGRGRSGLPVLPMPPASSLIGRETAIAALIEYLSQARLVTLTGPGGVGKTRLALHGAHTVAPSFPGGVWLCDLTTMPSRADVETAVASMLGVDARAGEPLRDRIVAFLRSRHALVVFDNCEHALDDVARLVTALLAETPTTTVLATSRERLQVSGEQCFPVEPLPLPAGDEPTALAVQLFCERARAANPSFSLALAQTAVCDLCRALGGLPLAIEVAAARTATRAPADVLDELRTHGGELKGERARRGRHRSLHAVVAWSYDLLDPAQQDLFERMAVLAGGWSLDAASAIVAGESNEHRVNEALDELAERSLTVAATTGATTRWSMLEPVRAFAEHRLRNRNRYAETRDRHADHFVAFAELAGKELSGPNERSWADRLGSELGNLRVAHRWFLDNDRASDSLRLTSACYPWVFAGAPAEVSAWAADSAERFGDSGHPALIGALATAAVGAWRQGDHDNAIKLASQGVNLGGEHAPATRWALDALGDALIIGGRYDEANVAYRAAIPLAEALDDIVTTTNDMGSVALALAYQGQTGPAIAQADAVLRRVASTANPSALGLAHYFAGEVRLDTHPTEALPLLRRAITEAERAGNRFLLGVASLSLVSLEARTDNAVAALARYPRLITHWQQTGAWSQQWITVRTLIETLQRSGHNEAAAVLYGALIASPTASPVAGADIARLDAVVDCLTTDLGNATYSALRAQGAAMDDDSALAYALDVLSQVALVG